MLSWEEISLRLILAAVFGAVIGVERERKDWAAGMRTHMMVCMGSALIMLVSSFGFSDTAGNEYIELDPSRVAAQIVSGIGFIGAGAILFLKPATVLGLTTASGLWTVAGIGMATGGGMYFAASVTTVLSIIILWGLQPLQRMFSGKFQNKTITIVTKSNMNPKVVLDKLTEDSSIDYNSIAVTKTGKVNLIEVKLEKPAGKSFKDMITILQDNESVKKITWNK